MPETTNYMLLGYSVVVLLLVGSAVYLVLKVRSLRAELKMLETLDAEDQAKSPAPVREAPRESLAPRDARSSDVPL
jgi:hypothetical protein